MILGDRISGLVIRRFTRPDDPAALRTRKLTAVGVGAGAIFASLCWAVGFAMLGLWTPVLLHALFEMWIVAGLALLAWTGRLEWTVNLALLGCFTIMTAMQVVLGGIERSGIVSAWVIVCPLVSSMFLPRAFTVGWLSMFVLGQAALAAADAWSVAHAPSLPESFPSWNRFFNLCGVALLVVAANAYVVVELEKARKQANDLLLNILPAAIAERLQSSPGVIADTHAEVTVLFADLVGFTALAASADPADVVAMLDGIFSDFDALAARHGLEKIKTIGDAYMVVGGVPEPRADHAAAVAEMALDMQEALRARTAKSRRPLQLRIGLHSGPVVAGVIGRNKFSYDVWGDTVNTASRMESTGVVDGIQLTDATRRLLDDRFVFEERAAVSVKGKGEMRTWLLLGRRSAWKTSA